MWTRKLLWVVLCVAPLWAGAQPLADRVPDDALIYVGSSGADAMGPGYAGSHLKAVLDASDFSQLINEFLPQVMQRIGQEDAQAGQVLGIVSAIAKPLWKHPHAFYVGGIAAKDQSPLPCLAVLCEAGADAPQLLATLQNLVAQVQGAPVQVAVKEARGLVILSVGVMSPAFDALNGGPADPKAQSLAASKSFKDAMAQVVKDPSVVFYVNVEGILATGGQFVEAMGDPQAREMFPKIRDALGLAGLKQIIYAAGFDGKDWMEAGYVAAPAPRSGLLKMIDGKPLSADLLKVAPKTSTAVAAGRFSFSGLIAQLREGIGQFDPNARDQVDAALKQISQILGMDVQKDLFGSLGDEWVAYTDPNTGGYGLVGSVLVNRLADAAKAEQSFSKLETFINQMAASALQQSPEKITIAFQTREVGDLKLHYLAIPLVTPTWCIKDGNLYVSLYPQGAMAAAKFVAAKGPSILENESFLAVRKRLGQESAGAIQFADLEKMVPINYGSWVAVSRLVGVADLFGVKSPLVLMPPLSELMANLGPAGAVSWSDDLGLHMKGISPFPGSTILGTDPMSAYLTSAAPMSIGLALPAVSKARESAKRVSSMSNLRQIGVACQIYVVDHGKYPPDLGSLLQAGLTPNVFVSPQGGQTVPPEVATMTAEQKAAWVNEHSDYVYLGKGLGSGAPADQPVAHEKLENAKGQGINILFGDGHVEFAPMAEARRILAEKTPKP